jgi:GNAT superfamily N-acetyltransferase
MVAIRRATVADAERLIELRVALLRESGDLAADADAGPLGAALRDYLARALPTGEFLAWVAEVDGLIVASSGLNLFRRIPSPANLSGRAAYVMNMYTVADWRGRGLATALFGEILAHARLLGVEHVWLRATADGRRIYRRFGFVDAVDDMELRL